MRFHMVLLCASLLSLIVSAKPGVVSSATQSPAAKRLVYLPALITPQPTSPGEGTGACAFLNQQEQQVLALMRTAPEQRRERLLCSPQLTIIARQHADEMASSGAVSHIGPTGLGPNARARKAGYALPTWYPSVPQANTIESIGGGQSGAHELWSDFMASSAHRDHMLGLVPTYSEQTDIGVAYVVAPNSWYRYYWVVVTARNP